MKSGKQTKSVCVIGGGIIGSWAALHLAEAGVRTTLVEQFPLPHTRGSSHGLSRAFRLLGELELGRLDYAFEPRSSTSSMCCATGIQTMFVMIRNLVFSLLTLTTTAAATTGDHFQITTLAPGLLMISTDQGSYSNNSLIFTYVITTFRSQACTS